MTHSELCHKAGNWLRYKMRCKVVLVEPKPWSCYEHVDAIGWAVNGESIVVECKTSDADFTRDYRKRWRVSSNGMGMQKYYMVEEGKTTFAPEDGIGLLVVKGRIVCEQVAAHARQQRCWSEEIALLLGTVTPWYEDCVCAGCVDGEKVS